MKKFVTDKSIAIVLLFVIFLFSNIIIPAGIGGENYYEYASGGFVQKDENSGGMVFIYSAVNPENFYNGSMNWVLRPLSKALQVYDVRIAGFILFFIVLCFFAFLIYKIKFNKKWHGILFEFFTVFVFGDFAYLLHFNTMTSQGLLLAAVLIMSMIIIYQIHVKHSVFLDVLYGFLCVFSGGLKEGWFLTGILFAVLLLSTLGADKTKKRLVSVLSVAIVSVICTCLLFGNGVSDTLKKHNLENSVFYGILKDNPDQNDSFDMISKEDAKKYAGKSNFEIQEDININASYGSVLSYYMKNFGFFAGKLQKSAGNAFEIRAMYLNNTADGKIKNGFNLYSLIKRRFMQPDLWFVIAVMLAMILFCCINIIKENDRKIKSHYIYLIMLSIVSLYAFVAPTIISGEAQLPENLFLYNIIFDVMIVNAVAGGAIIASKRRDELKRKYGLNQ